MNLKYMGSKARLAKEIAPIINKLIKENNIKTYIEPFVGGANMIEHIICERKIGIDNNEFLIAMWKALPNYVEGEHDVLVIPDCSRSMYSQSGSDYTPLEVAVSIAIYFAERNSGEYKNYSSERGTIA